MFIISILPSHSALRYYSDGPGIDSRWCHWIFQWRIPSDSIMALRSTQPLVKMSNRNIPGGKGGRCVRLTTSPNLCAECHGNLGDYTYWKALGHTGPVTGLLYLFLPYHSRQKAMKTGVEKLVSIWGLYILLHNNSLIQDKQQTVWKIMKTDKRHWASCVQ